MNRQSTGYKPQQGWLICMVLMFLCCITSASGRKAAAGEPIPSAQMIRILEENGLYRLFEFVADEKRPFPPIYSDELAAAKGAQKQHQKLVKLGDDMVGGLWHFADQTKDLPGKKALCRIEKAAKAGVKISRGGGYRNVVLGIAIDDAVTTLLGHRIINHNDGVAEVAPILRTKRRITLPARDIAKIFENEVTEMPNISFPKNADETAVLMRIARRLTGHPKAEGRWIRSVLLFGASRHFTVNYNNVNPPPILIAALMARTQSDLLTGLLELKAHRGKLPHEHKDFVQAARQNIAFLKRETISPTSGKPYDADKYWWMVSIYKNEVPLTAFIYEEGAHSAKDNAVGVWDPARLRELVPPDPQKSPTGREAPKPNELAVFQGREEDRRKAEAKAKANYSRNLIAKAYSLPLNSETDVYDVAKAATADELMQNKLKNVPGAGGHFRYYKDGRVARFGGIERRMILKAVRESHEKLVDSETIISARLLNRLYREAEWDVIFVGGRSALPDSPGMRMLQTRRLAERRCLARMARRLLDLPIKEDTTVRDYILRNKAVRSKVTAMLLSYAEITGWSGDPGGEQTARAKIDLRCVGDLLSRTQRRYAPDANMKIEYLEAIGKDKKRKVIKERAKAKPGEEVQVDVSSVPFKDLSAIVERELQRQTQDSDKAAQD